LVNPVVVGVAIFEIAGVIEPGRWFRTRVSEGGFLPLALRTSADVTALVAVVLFRGVVIVFAYSTARAGAGRAALNPLVILTDISGIVLSRATCVFIFLGFFVVIATVNLFHDLVQLAAPIFVLGVGFVAVVVAGVAVFTRAVVHVIIHFFTVGIFIVTFRVLTSPSLVLAVQLHVIGKLQVVVRAVFVVPVLLGALGRDPVVLLDLFLIHPVVFILRVFVFVFVLRRVLVVFSILLVLLLVLLVILRVPVGILAVILVRLIRGARFCFAGVFLFNRAALFVCECKKKVSV